jgi:hypothetical protein
MSEEYNEVKDNIQFEEAKIILRNFSGRAEKYNHEGRRNFCVLIEDAKVASDLRRLGWNVRAAKMRDPEDPQVWFLPVKVNYNSDYPPRVVMVTERGRRTLHEDTVEMLDYVRIVHADLEVSPYNYDVRGERGVSAYLQTMFVTVEESRFDEKYAEVPILD